jgi:hypothetical protein
MVERAGLGSIARSPHYKIPENLMRVYGGVLTDICCPEPHHRLVVSDRKRDSVVAAVDRSVQSARWWSGSQNEGARPGEPCFTSRTSSRGPLTAYSETTPGDMEPGPLPR